MKWIIWVKISCFNPADFRWAMSCRRIGELSQKRITNYFYLHYYFLRNKKINWHSIIHSDRIVVLSHHRLFYSKMDFYCFEFYVMSTLPNTATFDPPSVGIHFSNFFTLSIARKCLKTVTLELRLTLLPIWLSIYLWLIWISVQLIFKIN